MITTWQAVTVTCSGGKVSLSIHGITVEMAPLDALHLSDTLRTMANRSITESYGRREEVGE